MLALASLYLTLAALNLAHAALALLTVAPTALASTALTPTALTPAALVLTTALVLLAGLTALMTAMALVGTGLRDGGRRPRQAQSGATAHKNCVQAHVETSHRPASVGRPGVNLQASPRSGH